MTDTGELPALATHGWAVLVVLGSVVAAPAARAEVPDNTAQRDTAQRDPGEDRDPGEISGWIGIEVAEACRPFIPTGGPHADAAWNQLLSFASCVQDATVRHITEPAEVAALVEELHSALWPSLALYLHALEYGPPTVQLRAAFLAGMANLALITRLRSSLAPPGAGANAVAQRHYRALQDRLEPLLGRARETALIAFTAIDRATAQEPEIAIDAVTRGMVKVARDRLRAMTPTMPERARLPLATAGLAAAPARFE